MCWNTNTCGVWRKKQNLSGPVSYPRNWTGTSMKQRLNRGESSHADCFLRFSLNSMLDPVQPGGYQTNSEAEENAIIQLHEMNPNEWVIMYLFQTLLLMVPSTCSYYCYKGILFWLYRLLFRSQSKNRPPSPNLSLSLLGARRRDAGKEFTCPGTTLTSTASLR